MEDQKNVCMLTTETSPPPFSNCTPTTLAIGLLGWPLKHRPSLGNWSSQRQKTWRYIPHKGISRKCPGWSLLWTSPLTDMELPVCAPSTLNMSRQAEFTRGWSITGGEQTQTNRKRQSRAKRQCRGEGKKKV